MKIEQERSLLLKKLYERKFYDPNTPENTLQKVINFQKKLQDFKIRKKQSRQYDAHSHLLLIDEEVHQFRPITTRSLNRTFKNKIAQKLQSKIKSRPTASDLKLLLKPEQAGTLSDFTEPIRQKLLYLNEKNVNQWKRTPRLIDQQSNGYRPKRRSIQTANFYNQKKLSNSERKVNTSRVSNEANVIRFSEKSTNQNRISQSISRKVFIGGQDLEKAADQYYQNFKQIKKNISDYVQQQRKVEQKMKPLGQRKMVEHKTVNRQLHTRAKVTRNNESQKVKMNKTQPKYNKDEEDFIWNIELNPWNVGDS